jgi:hypothetical protein
VGKSSAAIAVLAAAVLAALLVGAGGWFFVSRVQSPTYPTAVTGDATLRLSGHDLRVVERRAAAGDVKAAQRLANHYWVSGKPTEAHYWLGPSAVRGDCRSIAMLFDNPFELDAQGNHTADQTEIAFWQLQFKRHGCTWENLDGKGNR